MSDTQFDPAKYLTNLRGQQYLEVKWRVVWFRSVHPAGRIDTEIMSTDPLLVKATVYSGDGNALATGHGGADAGGRKVVWSGREFEKAETAAIGRALAHAGYGTQFTGEVEGERLADSPVDRPASSQKQAPDKARVITKEEAAEVRQFGIDAGLTDAEIMTALGIERWSDWKNAAPVELAKTTIMMWLKEQIANSEPEAA